MFKLAPLCGALLIGIAGVGAQACRADDDGDKLSALVEKRADAICSVKATLRLSMKGQSQSQDTPMTLQGVMVTPDGLVMVSNLVFSPMRMMEMMGQSRGGEAPEIKYTPMSIKVLFAGDDKEYGAFLAATDTNLDLAFIQIEGQPGKKFPAVDFSASTQAALGQPVAAVSRMQKGYDYAPFFQTGRITGVLAKPRRAYTIEGNVSSLGLPVFALSGEAVGVLSTVAASSTDEASSTGASMTFWLRLMTGGSGGGFTFVLPATTVKGVIDQAAKRAAEVGAEREAKRKAGKPVEEPAPSAAKPSVKPSVKPALPGKKPGL